MHRTGVSRLLLVALPLLAGCASEAPTGADGALPKAQVTNVLTALSTVMSRALTLAMVPSRTVVPTGFGLPIAAPATEVINQSAPCDAGGTVKVTGSMEGTPSNSTVTTTVIMQECSAADGTGGRWTFTSTPSITYKATLTSTSSAYSIVGSQKGSFRYTAGAQKGTCNIDITFSSRMSLTGTGGGSGTFAGSVCGQQVNQTLTY
jgi:hypothetical protein